MIDKADLNADVRCQRCGKRPQEISEYIDCAAEAGMTPMEYVLREEGTLNPVTGLFWCTECYCELGMPLGQARELKAAP